jgi:uncharacterized repeat protein (TIGR03803 family)
MRRGIERDFSLLVQSLDPQSRIVNDWGTYSNPSYGRREIGMAAQLSLGQTSRRAWTGVTLCGAILFLSSGAFAQTFEAIYSFPSKTTLAEDALAESAAGTLFGTTFDGGKAGDGTVFQLTLENGNWTEKTIFQFSGANGKGPYSSLNLENNVMYGTTWWGGSKGAGNVFSLTQVNGNWKYRDLHNFTCQADGCSPSGNLLRDENTGSLYGMTAHGGPNHGGTLYRITREGEFARIYGGFTYGDSGCNPVSMRWYPNDKVLTIVGVAEGCGPLGGGAVFTVTESPKGPWHESVIFGFGTNDGPYPGGAPVDLLVDATGNIFGVTLDGGTFGDGTVFELKKKSGRWYETTIYSFAGGLDGANPVGIYQDPRSGSLYVTSLGAGQSRDGTLLKLARVGAGWKETSIEAFGRGAGIYPTSRVIQDPRSGLLYGTTSYSGIKGGGTIYKIGP